MRISDSQNIRKIVIGFLAAGTLGTGLYMMSDPHGWYLAVPGVINTGSHNHHFIRDTGGIYLTMGTGLFLGLRFSRFLQPALLFSTCWMSIHAFVHLWDIVASRLPSEHLAVDFPGVFMPPIILGVLAYREKNTTS